MSFVDAQTVVPATLANAATIGITGTNTVPQGFPTIITGEKAWVGADFANGETFVHYLTAAEISELKQALTAFKRKY